MGISSSPSLQLNTHLSSNGEGEEGNEGHEEEDRQQDCTGKDGQSHGASRLQGQDSWRPDGEGFGQEQNRKDCQQEKERLRQEEPVDCSNQEGTSRPQDQGLLRDQEGLTPVLESQGVLQCVSVARSRRLERVEHAKAPALGAGISAPVERRHFLL